MPIITILWRKAKIYFTYTKPPFFLFTVPNMNIIIQDISELQYDKNVKIR